MCLRTQSGTCEKKTEGGGGLATQGNKPCFFTAKEATSRRRIISPGSQTVRRSDCRRTQPQGNLYVNSPRPFLYISRSAPLHHERWFIQGKQTRARETRASPNPFWPHQRPTCRAKVICWPTLGSVNKEAWSTMRSESPRGRLFALLGTALLG